MNRPETQLNAEEIKRYQKYGYLVPRYRLSQGVLDHMRDAYDRLLAANSDISSDFMLGPHLEQPGAQGVRGSRE